jgi:putative endonuclease
VSEFAYTYVLRCSDGKLYVGSTADLKRRIKEHEGGLVPATSYRLPAKLVYYEACRSELQARKRELQLKTGFGRRYLKAQLGM